MILHSRYRKGGTVLDTEVKKTGNEWAVKLTGKSQSVALDSAVVALFRLWEEIMDTDPAHGFGCECDACVFFKERDARKRLE